jgi:dethiobiotin synthetase
LKIQEIIRHIETIGKEHNLVFVEGIGGLMVPIKKNILFIDVISELKSPVILTAKNKIGVINQTLLNIEILKNYLIKCISVVLMMRKNRICHH